MLALAALGGFTFATVSPSSALTTRSWVEIQTPHFILLTDADPRKGRNVALEFEVVRNLYRNAIGDDVDTALPVVIFAVRDSADFRELFPGLGAEVPLGAFVHSPDRHRIAIRLDAPEKRPFRAVYHEFHHLLFRAAFGRAPTWLVEGLAEFWSAIETRPDGTIEIGRPRPEHLRTLRAHRSRTIPLTALLRFEGKVHEEPPERIAMLYAESWALVHYLMIGNRSNGRARLKHYLALLDSGEDRLKAFESAVGPVAAAENGLTEYLDQTMFPTMRVDAPEPPSASAFRTRELSTAEASASVGMFLVAGGHADEAVAHLEQALALDPKSTLAMEGLGYLRFLEGDAAEAESWFRRFADFEANRDGGGFLAHYYLAKLVADRMGSTAEIRKNLERAIELNPRFAPAIVALSVLLVEEDDHVGEALSLAERATELAPDDAGTWRNYARLLEKVNRTEEALRALERASALEGR